MPLHGEAFLQNEFPNPLDRVEDLMFDSDLQISRTDDQELVLSYPGLWTTHHIYMAWHTDAQLLHLSCGLDMHVRGGQRAKIDELISIVNQRLIVGHFEVCAESKCISFRHGLLLRGQGSVSTEQIEDLVDITVNEADRYYPAFQWVMWGNREPAEALEASLLDTVGEA